MLLDNQLFCLNIVLLLINVIDILRNFLIIFQDECCYFLIITNQLFLQTPKNSEENIKTCEEAVVIFNGSDNGGFSVQFRNTTF